MSIFGELSRRNVIRVSIAYIIAAWIIVQVADLVLENIGAPDWVIQSIMLIIALGLPVVIVFSWVYEMTPEGIKRESEIDRTQSVTGQTGRKLDRAIIAFLVIALAYFVWESRVATPRVDSATPVAATSEISNSKALSIAVLPFQNRSNREDDEFFTEGMHDDLLTTIAKIGALKVISRTSVMEYKDTTKKIPEIARELGVANILEGGVQRSGNSVRINMQLIDAVTDEHLWAEIYDRELTAENLFAIQSEVSRAIAKALHATLSPEEQERINSVPTDNLEAYDAYMRARRLAETRESVKLDAAIAQYKRVLTLDPNFALAWVGLADAYNLATIYGTVSREEAEPQRRIAIDNALRIDPDLGEAYASLGSLLADQGEPLGAEAAFRKAIALSPNYATGYHWLSNALRFDVLRADESLKLAERAAELDPRSAIISSNLAASYLTLGDFERAQQAADRLIQMHPEFVQGYASLSAALDPQGKLAENLKTLQMALELDPGSPNRHNDLHWLYKTLREDEKARLAHEAFLALGPDPVYAEMMRLANAIMVADRSAAQQSASRVATISAGRITPIALPYGYSFLGDAPATLDAILGLSAEVDYTQPESWPTLVRTNMDFACRLAWAFAETGDKDRSQGLLDEAFKHYEVLFPKAIKHADRFSVEYCYLVNGDIDKALAVMELQLAHGHFSGWNITHVDGVFDQIRDDPRYLALRKRFDEKIDIERAAAGL